jgi:hypothetical protein
MDMKLSMLEEMQKMMTQFQNQLNVVTQSVNYTLWVAPVVTPIRPWFVPATKRIPEVGETNGTSTPKGKKGSDQN